MERQVVLKFETPFMQVVQVADLIDMEWNGPRTRPRAYLAKEW